MGKPVGKTIYKWWVFHVYVRVQKGHNRPEANGVWGLEKSSHFRKEFDYVWFTCPVFDLLEDDYDDIAMEKRTMKFQGETPRFP